ncbi:MAG: response regulator, partial [Desulfobacteria bacterium]
MEPSREARTPILVVNNDPAVRDMLSNLLSGEGFHVALAESGTEALKIAANALFDTALVELFLPDYSGVEFKRRLARVSPKTRVVVLSSFTTIRSSDDVLRFGTSDFILDQREIVELLRAASAVRPAIAMPVAEDERLKKCLVDTVDILISLLEVNY